MQAAKIVEQKGDERWLAIGVTLLFLGISLSLGYLKLLWGDEFVTYWVGQQRSFSGIWKALRLGADPNPPLMHVLSWWSTAAFGAGATAIRLPSVLGVGLALLGTWSIVRRYATAPFAALACLALMTSRGFDYSYDARSYGLLMGFAVAALACWITSLESRFQAFWFLLMALCLAADLSSNYYGVMAFFPLTAGELCWSLRNHKLRPLLWFFLLLAALPLLPYLTLIRGNIAEFGPHAWNKPQLSMITESYFILVEGLFWTTSFVGALTLWKRFKAKRQTPAGSTEMSPSLTAVPAEVQTALWVLVLYPFLGFAIAYGGAGMISARCAIPVCAGFAIAGSLLFARLASPRWITGCLVFLTLWVVAREAACAEILREQRQAFFQLRNQVEQATAPGEKLLVGDSLLAMPLWWYSSATVRSGLLFPIDFAAIHQTESDDSGEQNLWGGRQGVFPVPIAKPSALIEKGQEYIYLGSSKGWLGKELANRGFSVVEDQNAVDWDDLGGVFTPLDHPTTRLWFARPTQIDTLKP